ncbi:isovaleryl-CoA dehydrogenase [Pusillimonas sp. TS35]|nr:isovaleryl-CoA dehydrogenase [Pusillimonas sp. TS35]
MSWTTHDVTNQPPELVDYNLYDTDMALREGVRREGASAHEARLVEYGAALGTQEAAEWADQANRCGPVLQAFDARGYRVDRVRYHPAWLHFLRMAYAQGMHGTAWRAAGGGAQVARAAAYLMHGQIEAGSLCPVTMTAAAIPILRQESWFASIEPLLYSQTYDERDIPLARKRAMGVGMGMTEKQGGSDLRANTTRATPVHEGSQGRNYRLVGHKWFFSAPTSDAHLVLARAHDALSCFYVPRWLEDGSRNGIRIQRLKDKLGNRSNASAEIEFQDAMGVMVGEEGRGVATLVEMASYTRLDCVLGSAALLRAGVVRAVHHARHRMAFGKLLAEQPLMQSVLADLILESEAALVLALRLAGALDARGDADQDAWRRLMAPAAKFWVCKRAIQAVAECMEVLGGNGYIEEGPLARLYRETPVNAIWEGSGNIMCLDVLRALQRDASAVDRVQALVRDSTGDSRTAARAKAVGQALADQQALPARAREVTCSLVLLTQAMLLRAHAPQFVADAFIQSRFGPAGQGVFGAWAPSGAIARALIDRAWPA